MEGPVRPIASPEEELAYLRAQVAAKEAELNQLKESRPREEIAHERIVHHRTEAPSGHFAEGYRMHDSEATALSLNLDPEQNDETMEELRGIMETKGVRNALAVLEKLQSPHLDDDFHRYLVQYLLAGMKVPGMREHEPEWKALHMTLYEVALPEATSSEEEKTRVKPLKELISSMEQFYAGMLSLEHAHKGEPPYFSLELAVPVNAPHLRFYAAVPNTRRDLFEKQLLAIFPNARISVQPNDYNVFVEGGANQGSYALLADKPIAPLRDYADFDYDPLNSILNAFEKIAHEGEGASFQMILKPAGNHYIEYYRKVLHALRQGQPRAKAFALPETFVGDLAKEAFNIVAQSKKNPYDPSKADQAAIEAVEKKIASPVLLANLRLVVSSADPVRAQHLLTELEASFNQFENTKGNRLTWKRAERGEAKKLFRNFSFRLFADHAKLPLSLKEVTTMYHFPPKG
ncbi:MAG TPA: hypothetical protein VEA36_02020, partial [Candidatus Paceibacterota bacterium]|nr:hypothetical protein [Candidatus Paceibacterota bacterium]